MFVAAFIITIAGAALASPVPVDLVFWDAASHRVDVVGSFNGWLPGRHSFLHEDGDTWTCHLQLEPGRYEYKFILDGARYTEDPRNGRMDARTGNSILQVVEGADVSRNFNRRVVRHRFEIPAGSGSSVFVAGEFSRWAADRFPLQRDPADGIWRAVLYLPPGPSDLSVVQDGVWKSADPDGDGRRFFFRVEDPAQFHIEQGYLRGPQLLEADHVTLRGRLMPPPAAPGSPVAGFSVRAFLNNVVIPASFDDATGYITLEAANLKPGLNTVSVNAERDGVRALPALYHIVRATPGTEVSPVIRAPHANQHHVTFHLREADLTYAPINTVAVAGAFNNWNKESLFLAKVAPGEWEAEAWLPSGEHEYKFVLNGSEWQADPRNSRTRGEYGNSLLTLASPRDAAMPPAAATGLSRHVRDAILYEIMVARYCDSDGDGIGDFRGLTSKLDTIRRLGVNWIYLMPIFESPNFHGYGTTDYYTIKRELGTIDDFRAFLAAAHARGIRVMLDYVFYHSSSDNPIFLLAGANATSPWRAWHHWTGETTWSGYGTENSAMPGWNYDNPAMRRYAIDVALYWQAEGVDGFRCDVAHSVPDDFWMEWATALKARDPDVLLFPEFNEPSFDLYYDFSVTNINDVFKGQSVNRLDDVLSMDAGNGRVAVRFLDYHDKDRALTLVDGDRTKNQLAALFLMTTPGVPMLYYGEEVGMEGWMGKNTNREMMEWDFPDILLREYYRALIRLRRERPALRTGLIRRVLVSNEERVYAYLRQEGNERVIVVLNFEPRAVQAKLDLSLLRPSPRAATLLLGLSPGGHDLDTISAALSGSTLTVPLGPSKGTVILLE